MAVTAVVRVSASLALSVCGALMAFACAGGQTGSEGAEGNPPPGGVPPGGPTGGMGGQGMWPTSGNSGYSCTTSAQCLESLEAAVAELGRPREAAPRVVVAASCEREDPDAGCSGGRPRSCTCAFKTAGGEAEPLGLGLATNGNGCDYLGRSYECLIPASDFAGCTPGDDCSCVPACEDALRKIEDDNARVFDAEARHAECVEGYCRVVRRVEDRCFVGFGDVGDEPYDCALSDDEILGRAFPDAGPPPDCTNGCAVRGTSSGCGFAVGVCGNCYADAGPLDCSDADGGT